MWRSLAVGLACAGLAAPQNIPVSEFTLNNGMKVLIHEDHDIPNVALYLFFKVGSRNERPGATGMSHFFEHMMFNGAKKFGPKMFDIVMEKNGGRNNAYTNRDLTVYQDWFPSTAADLIFDLEADRIRDLAFDPKIIESERGVVYSERRLRVDNDNFGMLFEHLGASAYLAHPYQWPVVGWASDIEAWTIDDLKQHFRMGYAPNNCVLVVAGALKQADVLSLARKHLEPVPRQEPPPPVRTREPAQVGERRVVVRKAAQAPLLMVSYHIPETRHPDWWPIQLMRSVLSDGRSSRLYRRLIDTDQLAVSIESFTQESLDPGQFVVFSQLRPGASTDKAEQAIYAELARLRDQGATADELTKARNQVMTSLFRTLKTINGKANAIGEAEVFHGGYQKLNSLAADLEKITAADLQRVARQYLGDHQRTVGILAPEESRQ
jgi:zinc protease